MLLSKSQQKAWCKIILTYVFLQLCNFLAHKCLKTPWHMHSDIVAHLSFHGSVPWHDHIQWNTSAVYPKVYDHNIVFLKLTLPLYMQFCYYNVSPCINLDYNIETCKIICLSAYSPCLLSLFDVLVYVSVNQGITCIIKPNHFFYVFTSELLTSVGLGIAL